MAKDEIKRMYFSLAQVAERLDIAKSTVDFWAREMNMNVHMRGDKRRFTEKDMNTLQTIKDELRISGKTLYGTMRTLISERKKSGSDRRKQITDNWQFSVCE